MKEKNVRKWKKKKQKIDTKDIFSLLTCFTINTRRCCSSRIFTRSTIGTGSFGTSRVCKETRCTRNAYRLTLRPLKITIVATRTSCRRIITNRINAIVTSTFCSGCNNAMQEEDKERKKLIYFIKIVVLKINMKE